VLAEELPFTFKISLNQLATCHAAASSQNPETTAEAMRDFITLVLQK